MIAFAPRISFVFKAQRTFFPYRDLKPQFSQPRIVRRILLYHHTATMSTTTPTMNGATPVASKPKTFQSLQGKVHPALLAALKEMKFETMSPVQEKVMEMLPTVGSDW